MDFAFDTTYDARDLLAAFGTLLLAYFVRYAYRRAHALRVDDSTFAAWAATLRARRLAGYFEFELDGSLAHQRSARVLRQATAYREWVS